MTKKSRNFEWQPKLELESKNFTLKPTIKAKDLSLDRISKSLLTCMISTSILEFSLKTLISYWKPVNLKENTAFKAQTYGWKLDHFPIKKRFRPNLRLFNQNRSLQPKLFDVNRNFVCPANHPVQSKFSIFSQHSWFRLKLQVLLKF